MSNETTTTETTSTELDVLSAHPSADTLVAMSEVAADATFAFHERLRRNFAYSFGLTNATFIALTAAWLKGGMPVPVPSADEPE